MAQLERGRPLREAIAPLIMSGYVCIVASSGFACGVRGLPWWYQILVAAATALSVAGLWMTHLTDPGILPASLERDPIILLLEDDAPDIPDRQRYIRSNRGTWMRHVECNPRSGPSPDPEEGGEWDKWCTSCNLWRPPRSHHCSFCHACMERYDHHCGLVGNCIAVANHRFFAAFLVAAQVGCLLMLGGAVWRLRRLHVPSPEAWESKETYILITLAVCYGYHSLMLCFGTGHCCAILLDITTKDLMTGAVLWRNAPFCPGQRSPHNLARSWARVCCSPVRWRGTTYGPLPQHDLGDFSA